MQKQNRIAYLRKKFTLWPDEEKLHEALVDYLEWLLLSYFHQGLKQPRRRNAEIFISKNCSEILITRHSDGICSCISPIKMRVDPVNRKAIGSNNILNTQISIKNFCHAWNGGLICLVPGQWQPPSCHLHQLEPW